MGIFKETKNKEDNSSTFSEISADQAQELVEEHEKLMDKQAIEYTNLINRISNSPYLDKSFCNIINHIMLIIANDAINGEEDTSFPYYDIQDYIDSDSPIYKYNKYLISRLNKASVVDAYWSLIDDYLTDELGYMVHYETDISLHKTVTISWGKD